MPTDTIVLDKDDVKVTPKKPVNGRGFVYAGRGYKDMPVEIIVIGGKAKEKKT